MDPEIGTFVIVSVVIAMLIIIIITGRDVLERLSEHLIEVNTTSIGDGWVRLYEDWNYGKGPPNPPEARKWEITDTKWMKKMVNVNLKSYDIKVPNGGKVELWAIYPESPVPNQATNVIGNAYTDEIAGSSEVAYRTNSAKYRKIVEVQGAHIKGTVDYPVKRVMVISNLSTSA